MVPKPFPHPFQIGTDLCSINRIAGLLSHHRPREQFIRRNFTRLEWPLIWKSFQRASDNTTRYDDWVNSRTASGSHTEKSAKDAGNSSAEGPSIWSLPEWSKPCKSYNDEVLHETSPLGHLVRHIAGRWAAKESVIKAHSRRHLYMNEISIISPRLCPYLFSLEDAQSTQTKALIDPPSDSILMDETVAEMRGLKGFGPQSRSLPRGAVVQKNGRYYCRRRSKINESQRQMAEVSISHDGGYAVAVCLAPAEPVSEVRGRTVIDDGKGSAMHEPSWGDEGWFHKDWVDYEGSSIDLRMAVEDALKGAQDDIMSSD